MACWKSADRRGQGLRCALLATLVLLAACSGDKRDGTTAAASQLAITGLEQRGAGGHELVLAIRLGRPLRQALESGVPLTFRLDLDTAGGHHRQWRELRFAPLSRRYQIHDPATGYRRSYDSRAAALTALERWPLAADGDVGTGAATPLRARVRLDTARLPAPLVLPALFSRNWHLDSGRWHAGQA